MNDDLWVWGHDKADRKMLHTMLRVGDPERSIIFYRDLLGMKLLNKWDFEDRRFSLYFLSFSGDYNESGLELTHNWDADNYCVGDGFGHVAVGLPDFDVCCEKLREEGIEFTSEPMVMLEGGPRLAIVKDPDGYAVELIEITRKFM